MKVLLGSAAPSKAASRVAVPWNVYRTPGDPPCLPAINPLWPGMPRWVELESSRLAAMEANGWEDEESPSPAQHRFIRHLGGVVPFSRDEATRLITRLKRALQRDV